MTPVTRALSLATLALLCGVPAGAQSRPLVSAGEWVRLNTGAETVEARVVRATRDSVIVQPYAVDAAPRAFAWRDLSAACVSRYTGRRMAWGAIAGGVVGAAAGVGVMVLALPPVDDGTHWIAYIIIGPLAAAGGGLLGSLAGNALFPPGLRHHWESIPLRPALTATADGRIGVALSLSF